MSEDHSPTDPPSYDRQALEAIHSFLLYGHLPAGLPESVQTDPALQDVVDQLERTRQFVLDLANGNLEPELKMKGRVAGALKSLQANLRHLTWQTQRIAEGDLSQQVHFMGDFATAFNRMVENLRQSRQALESRAQELAEGRQTALSLMEEAQRARQDAVTANTKLQEQIKEIRALQAQLAEQAIRDPLTGCFNRRYLDNTLEREFARAQREAYPISLVMIDIDHFKRVNDRYGHPAGDLVLQQLSTLMRNCTRAGDIICRYGGEEFLMMLPNINLQDALRRADFCRSAFQDLTMVYENQKINVTVSMGVASFPMHGAVGEQVIKAADQALYLAKNSGRNCVCAPG